jgi:hypothetical protein
MPPSDGAVDRRPRYEGGSKAVQWLALMCGRLVPITTSMVMASLSWKPMSQGDTMSVRPAIRLSHSSQTANAASAAVDSTAMKIAMIEAVCHCAPVDGPKSQGEKNRIMPGPGSPHRRASRATNHP